MIHAIKNRFELLLPLLIISGCTITVGTTSGKAPFSRVQESTYHYVRRGENLFRISKYYYAAETIKDIHEGVNRIKTANKLVGEQLSTGQRLLIPGTTKKQPSFSLLPPDAVTPSRPSHGELPGQQPPAEEFRPMITDKAFIWPVTGKIMCGFGELDNQGIDILAAPGTNVLASDDGRIVFSGTTPKYQETVIIEHAANTFTVYGHDLDILVKQGDAVKKGDVIGKIKSGTTRIRYLHFEIRIDNTAVNPVIYLPEQPR